MGKLVLVFPGEEHESAWKDIINEFESAGEKIIPYGLWLKTRNYSEYLRMTRNFRDNIDIPSHLVQADTYFLMFDGDKKILGAVNIRHSLNENLLKTGGHIGYGIAPSERRKGYATELLKAALKKCKELSISSILVTCDKDNIGSAKTIKNNGGILEDEFLEEDGNIVQRYWINQGL